MTDDSAVSAEPASRPDPEPEPVTADAAEPRWASLDAAWPLGLVAGFAGTWAGLSTGLPGAAALLASLALAPLHLGLVGRGELGRAALVGLGWAFGVGGAIVGSVFEGAGGEIAPGLPTWEGAVALVSLGDGAGSRLVVHLAVFGLALVAGRWTRGLVTLVAAAGAVGAAAWIAAEAALPNVRAGRTAMLAIFEHGPPALVGEAVALVLAAVALAFGSSARPRGGLTQSTGRAGAERARSLLLGALALEILALAAGTLR